MSEQTSQEPTMEEILASIRRIISEDDQPAEAEAPVAMAPEPVMAAPAPTPASEPDPEPLAPTAMAEAEAAPDEDDDILELTDTVESHGDLAVVSSPAATSPEPPPMPEPAAIETLVSDQAATAAASAFGVLSAAVAMPKGDRTLEDVVRELLRLVAQQWLDANLPGIVQQAVETEVERIARSRVR